MSELKIILVSVALVACGSGCVQREIAEHPSFSGVYRPAGLEVQPCGRNEWVRRSFETDTFCGGDNSGFPYKPEGLERWKAYNVIDDPVLGCIEDFPRNAMRGRPMRVTLGDEPRAQTALQRAQALFVAVGDARGVPYTDAKPALTRGKQPGA